MYFESFPSNSSSCFSFFHPLLFSMIPARSSLDLSVLETGLQKKIRKGTHLVPENLQSAEWKRDGFSVDQPGNRAMEKNGGNTASRTPGVPVFLFGLIAGSKGAFRLPGPMGSLLLYGGTFTWLYSVSNFTFSSH